MAKLSYWIAHALTDSPVYSIRCKTKREVHQQLKAYDINDYSLPQKVTIEYSSAFDLMHQCIAVEGGLDEGQFTYTPQFVYTT